jgi:diguanylate cyclase (GGDEF)-like protein
MGLVKILNVNRATINLYQAKTKTDLLTSLDTVLMEDSLNEFRDELTALIRGEKKFECEISQKKLNGEIFNGWFRFSVPVGYENTWERLYISIVDITDRKKGEEKLRYMSFHDALTGLYNRAYFEEELARLEGSRQYPVSLIACDLDGLKYINDKLGHSTGDQAIKSVAKILGSNTFRKEDVVARIGGDEFVMILPSVDLNQTKEVLERIEDKIVEFNNSSIEDNLYRPISLSLGFAVVQKDGSLLEGYKTADQAMYLNKQKKKGF